MLQKKINNHNHIGIARILVFCMIAMYSFPLICRDRVEKITKIAAIPFETKFNKKIDVDNAKKIAVIVDFSVDEITMISQIIESAKINKTKKTNTDVRIVVEYLVDGKLNTFYSDKFFNSISINGYFCKLNDDNINKIKSIFKNKSKYVLDEFVKKNY